jgi:hypothetical protein
MTRGRCYDHYIFSAIFANFRRKNGVFLKNKCFDQILAKTTPIFYPNFFGENIFRIITSGPEVKLYFQIISLMDKILQQENLDLKLTPYRVLATSSKHGFVQVGTLSINKK